MNLNMENRKISKEKTEEKKVEEKKIAEAKEEKVKDAAENKKIPKEKTEKKVVKKDKAVVNAKDLPISTKHCMAICRFIKGKTIEQAVKDLEQVIVKRKAVPMKGEIPHRKGMRGGRYPIKASKIFIKLLKSLNANSAVNGMDNVYISSAIPNIASKPHKRSGSQRFKRTHIYLEAKERKIKEKENKKEEKK